jgi:hypothetical protein
MDYGRLSWRGIIDVEADRVALRDAEGAPHDIRDLFLLRDDIGTVREVSTEIGGGLTYTTLSWNDEDDQPPTDDQVPGLASLLRYLDEDRPAKTINIYATRNYRPVIAEYTFNNIKRVTVHTRRFEVSGLEPPLLIKKNREIYRPTALRPWVAPEAAVAPVRKGLPGAQGPRGRSVGSLDVETMLVKRAHYTLTSPKHLTHTSESTFIFRRVQNSQVSQVSQVSQMRRGLCQLEAPTIILRQQGTVTSHTHTSHTHTQVFVSEPMPGARGAQGARGSRGPRGFAVADCLEPVGRRGPPGVVGVRGPRGYALADIEVAVARRGPVGAVGARGPRG